MYSIPHSSRAEGVLNQALASSCHRRQISDLEVEVFERDDENLLPLRRVEAPFLQGGFAAPINYYYLYVSGLVASIQEPTKWKAVLM
jgi:hypothetical protein